MSTPDRLQTVPMLANTRFKPNGPLTCGLQRFPAPKPSNRADRFASNRISAHGSDSKVVDDRFVVPLDRVPNPFDSESRSPPIEGWFGGSRQHCTNHRLWAEPAFDRRRCWLDLRMVWYTLPRHREPIIYHLRIRAVS